MQFFVGIHAMDANEPKCIGTAMHVEISIVRIDSIIRAVTIIREFRFQKKFVREKNKIKTCDLFSIHIYIYNRRHALRTSYYYVLILTWFCTLCVRALPASVVHDIKICSSRVYNKI